jgi:hypothetical protein
MIAYIPSGEFTMAFAGHRANPKLMVLLRAYFDESGTHAGSPAVVVGGYMSNDDQWGRFDVEWAKILSDEGLLAFRMTDCENSRGEFVGWDKDRRRRVLGLALTTIRLRTWARVSVAVNVADFNAAASVVRETCPTPYFLCVSQCIKVMAKWADKYAPNAQIAYVFEQGCPFQSDVHEMMRGIMRDPGLKARHRVASWSFANKRDFLPLQAADIYVYECWKEVTNRLLVLDPAQRRDRRKSLGELLRSQHGLFYVDADDLVPFAQDVQTIIDAES